MIPKLNTSLFLEALPMEPHSDDNNIAKEKAG
jgi:hypothetical protein